MGSEETEVDVTVQHATSRKVCARRGWVVADDRPTAIDLFCGCGGLTAGLTQAGFRVLAGIDIDRLAIKTYSANHPGVRTWRRNIHSISPPSVLKKLGLHEGDLDLIAGCPPCQGFSSLRTLNGSVAVEDDRNDLIKDFLRFVKGLRPKAVMMENVPELADDGRFADFCDKFGALGYRVNWDILDAQHYGVPQRRRRLVFLAGRGAKIDFAPEAETAVTVRDAIEGLPPAGHSGDPAHDHGESRKKQTMERIAKIPKDGGSRTDLPESDQLPCHRRCNGFKDVYGRMAWGSVSPTITSGCFNPSKGRFLHPEEDRAITLREAAMLQSFPAEYSFPDCSNKSAVALMIGNALPPEFIKRHASQIRGFIERTSRLREAR